MKFQKVAMAAAIALTVFGASAQSAKSKFSAEIGYTAIDYAEPGVSGVKPSVVRTIFGYEVNENLALEGMLGFGAANGSATVLNVPVDLKIDSLYGLYIKPKAMVAENLEIFGRFGYATSKATASARGVSFSTTNSTASYGVGVSYFLSPSTALSLDYMSYYDKDGVSAKGVTLGVGFKF